MDDYAPPSSPPPPKAPDVPAGWYARWNKKHREWFYVNVYTKKSQWEKPTAPVFPVDENDPDNALAGHEPGSGPAPADTKNPYRGWSGPENAGGAQPPAGHGGPRACPQSSGPYPQEQLPIAPPPRDQERGKGGILGKFLGKGKTTAGSQQGGYGGHPPQPPQQGYYQPPPSPQQYGAPGDGYGGQPGYMQQQPPPKKGGMGGMGKALAGGALGVGAGVLGGALISKALRGHGPKLHRDGYGYGPFGGFGGGGDGFVVDDGCNGLN